MWFRWTKLQPADIPVDVRIDLELRGEAVVAQLVSRAPVYGVGVVIDPKWNMTAEGRALAMAWLREQYAKRERRRDIGETVEIAILLLVAIEAIPSVLNFFRHLS